MVRQHPLDASMFMKHKPVYLDGEPIGCAATKEQAIGLIERSQPTNVAVTETAKAFHLSRPSSGTFAG